MIEPNTLWLIIGLIFGTLGGLKIGYDYAISVHRRKQVKKEEA